MHTASGSTLYYYTLHYYTRASLLAFLDLLHARIRPPQLTHRHAILALAHTHTLRSTQHPKTSDFEEALRHLTGITWPVQLRHKARSVWLIENTQSTIQVFSIGKDCKGVCV